MKYRWPIACLLLLPALPPSAAEPAPEVRVSAPHFRTTISHGGIVELQNAKGNALARGGTDSAARIHWISDDVAAPASDERHRITSGQSAVVLYDFGPRIPGSSISNTYGVDALTGDLVIQQTAGSPRSGSGAKSGLWGVSWSIGEIPGEFSIIVPGRSGIRLDARSPGDKHVFDYPQAWEAQIVIVEGGQGGFYIFADDPEGRYKRLTVTRTPGGWHLQLATINDAPFENLADCASVRWRLNAYDGDWRVPARRYRQWATENFKPETLATRGPAWARDIRTCVIAGMSEPLIEALAKRLDPKQTLLYIPDWRQDGYDRDYPDYTEPRKNFGPFLARAHELGFRVMPHVNYFGVDPLNAEYRDFEAFHVRGPWGKHEHLWWTWDRAEPPIKFAYINPASSAWRKRFVGAMVELCRRFPIDALHLDQTLCIYNDHNGRIDGMNMIAGNLALHRDLRAALPDVALSGEGLNEVTCRYESFAQRHVWGLNHSEGTWDEARLSQAHPISSYLFLPHTTIYGYLGMVAPDAGQLYAAWNEAYRHFGVIPTLKTSVAKMASPTGFLRQFFDEAGFWQKMRLVPDAEGAWPPEVAFPFRTSEGGQARRMIDGRFLHGDRVVSHTLFGANRIETASSIIDWAVYDKSRIMGLDPAKRYPLFPIDRDHARPHISEFPSGLIAESVYLGPEIGVIRTRAARRILLDACREIRAAQRGITFGDREETLRDDSGARFEPAGDHIGAHPPYKNVPRGGASFARFRLTVPPDLRAQFVSRVALGRGAADKGRSDGVLFRAIARGADRELVAEHLQTSEEPTQLDLDLTPFAGREMTLELIVDPGPHDNASFDWAEWLAPRVEAEPGVRGPLVITPAQGWLTAIDAHGDAPAKSIGDALRIQAHLPGSVFLLKQPPPPGNVPMDLTTRQRFIVVGSGNGGATDAFVGNTPVGLRAVGGVSRPSIFAHPPPNGLKALHFPIQMPAGATEFRAHIGLADGSKSKGVIFAAEVNGREVMRQPVLPGGWREVRCDLKQWSGEAMVLSLITDSDGGYDFDWAVWGEPRIISAP